MPVKKSVLPTINKSGKEKREIDELCKHAEKLHGGKLVPIVDKETSTGYKKTANQPQAHIVKKYRIVEQVYVLNGPQKEEQLMISYLQRCPQTSKPKPTPKKANEKVVDITFNQKESGKFHGVIRYLTQKCGGNVHHLQLLMKIKTLKNTLIHTIQLSLIISPQVSPPITKRTPGYAMILKKDE